MATRIRAKNSKHKRDINNSSAPKPSRHKVSVKRSRRAIRKKAYRAY